MLRTSTSSTEECVYKLIPASLHSSERRDSADLPLTCASWGALQNVSLSSKRMLAASQKDIKRCDHGLRAWRAHPRNPNE